MAKAMFRQPVWMLASALLSLHVFTEFASAAEECAAPTGWFKNGGTPAPSTAEPKRGDDCAFYQRAWQTFLFSTEMVGKTPRLLAAPYKSYQQVFGLDKPAGLLGASADALVVAPRNPESPRATEAEDLQQAGSNAILIDQNGHPVFYNIVLNPVFVDFVVKRKLNKIDILKTASPKLEIPVGAVEYKAAWQIIDDPMQADHRITTLALVPWLIAAPGGKLRVDASRPLRPVTLAMIALHVVFRPQGHPEMVWATFEYNRNAPSLKGNPNNSGCLNPGEVSDESVLDDGKPYALFGNGTSYADANQNNGRPQMSVVDADKQIFSPKSNVVRAFPYSGCFPGSNQNHAIKEVDPAIVSLNENVLAHLSNDNRRSYSLVGAVWMDEPRNPNAELAFQESQSFDDFQLRGENRLSSTAMESMTQTIQPNCFSCHDTNRNGGLEAKRLNVSHIFDRFSKGK